MGKFVSIVIASTLAALSIAAMWKYELGTSSMPQHAGLLTFFVGGPIALFIWMLYVIGVVKGK